MARIESQAVAGFFPTPPQALRRAVALIRAPAVDRNWGSMDRIRIADPCAGEGAALGALIEHFGGNTAVLAVEMEKTRFATLEAGIKAWDKNVLHADLFRTVISDRSVNLLWLNPPYDHDKEYTRLEERFLQRCVTLLVDGGTLAYVVPAYALAASAVTLATHFADLRCYRFPAEEYGIYKQVVLFGRRVSQPAPDPRVEGRIRGWAENPNTITELPTEPDEEHLVHLLNIRPESLADCRVVGMDLAALASFDPWTSDKGPVNGIRPPDDLSESFHRRWPVATRPRAAHLSAALAAGVFNGAKVEADPIDALIRGYPPLLVKGTFDKEWRKIEDKTNAKGEKVAELQVQQPILSVTVLDLESGEFHQVSRKSTINPAASISEMSLADLIDRYGPSLMDSMLRACPVGFDPARDAGPPVDRLLGRPLFPAQLGVVHATLKLLDEDASRGVIVLGEIGSGKTSVALATAAARGCRRILVVCPPHLLDGWREQAAAVLPGARSVVLDTVTAVEDFFAPGPETRIGILSRERAKLGHGWASVSTPTCPRCGSTIEQRNYALKRELCEHELRRPTNTVARWVLKNLLILAQYFPGHAMIRKLFPTNPARARALRTYEQEPRPVDDLIRAVVLELAHRKLDGDLARWLVWAVPEAVQRIVDITATDVSWDVGELWKCLAFASSEPMTRWSTSSTYGSSWGPWERYHAWLYGRSERHPSDGWTWSDWRRGTDGPTYQDVVRGSEAAYTRLLDVVYAGAAFTSSKCGEPLYAAVPEPRRYPLATFIARRHSDDYDALILDEAHEFASDGSAQTNAAQRLLGARKAIRLLLTGSFTNGYADSTFLNMHAVSPKFRADFGRDDKTRFIDRYGYWKRVVEEKDDKGKVVAYGSQSDRVQRSARKAGVAPGILPVFLLEHLLPVAVTLQKEDLRLGIPPTSDHVHHVPMLTEQAANYAYLLRELTQAIRSTRDNPNRAGKLWGALAHLPSYLDRAFTSYEIRWPDSCGGDLIAAVPAIDPSTILPKEQWLIETVKAENAEGRNVLVFGWHGDVLPRLAALLADAGVDVAHLEADRVPTSKRQVWIDAHVVRPGKRALVVNPVAVATGLNNLVHCHTAIWMENPACNPAVYRQAQGRIDRIGQTLSTRFRFPLYGNSAQEKLHKLLLHKVGVSRGVDGLDPEEALRAAGVVDEEFSGFSVGRELYRMITGE